MTDREPGKPGQYRALITAAELEKLQAGEGFTITLTRDDQPIKAGTPYNKEAVLPDELAALICPDVDDPSPADAFRGLLNQMAAENLAPKLAEVYTWEQWDADPKVGVRTSPFEPPIIDSNDYYGEISYADELMWTTAGLALKDPVTAGTPTEESELSVLRNKYLLSSFGLFYVPEDAEFWLNGSGYWEASKADAIKDSQRLAIVASADPYAYPNEGEQGGYWYIASRQRGEEKNAGDILVDIEPSEILLAENAFTARDYGGYSSIDTSIMNGIPAPVVGEMYAVVLDGVEYTCVAYTKTHSYGEYIGIGDSYDLYNDYTSDIINGQPFVIRYDVKNGVYDIGIPKSSYNGETTRTFTLSISKINETATQLNPKYIPKAVAVADAAGDTPTATEFNALLAALRNAGFMAT